MAHVRLSLLAVQDLDRLVESHGLPPDTRERVRRSLRLLEEFPDSGRELVGRWRGFRFVVGPWPWLLIVYAHESDDTVTVVAMHDARSSSAAGGSRS